KEIAFLLIEALKPAFSLNDSRIVERAVAFYRQKLCQCRTADLLPFRIYDDVHLWTGFAVYFDRDQVFLCIKFAAGLFQFGSEKIVLSQGTFDLLNVAQECVTGVGLARFQLDLGKKLW